MSEERILEFLRKETKGAAPLLIAKRLNLTLVEVTRSLESLVKGGIVEKKGKNYRLKE